MNVYKIVLIASSENEALKAFDMAKSFNCEGITCTRSWSTGFEILNDRATKGYAIKMLSQKLRAKQTIAVGDYENDIQMIEMADIGYAVGNATEKVKSAADKVTKPVWESAMANIIEDLKKSDKPR